MHCRKCNMEKLVQGIVETLEYKAQDKTKIQIFHVAQA